jgi:hypothetical protein
VRALPRLSEFYPGICLTTEEKARKNLSQGKKNLSQGKSEYSNKSDYSGKSEYTAKSTTIFNAKQTLFRKKRYG